jgi:hypothetical protein
LTKQTNAWRSSTISTKTHYCFHIVANTLRQLRTLNTIPTTWFLRIWRKLSTASTQSPNVSRPKSKLSVARTAIFPWITSVLHHRRTIHRHQKNLDLAAYPPSPPYTPTSDTSDDDEIPKPPPPRIVSSTHVALLGEEDLGDLNLHHLDIRRILAKTSDKLTTDLTLE